jgi:hypothetical protein
MQLEDHSSTMELTADQVLDLLREELLIGLDAGELTEEQFVAELKTLRTVVDSSTFTLVAQPAAINNEEEK